MKRKSTPLVLLAALLVFFSSCSKKASVPVPADAAIVMHIDGKSLNSKLSWDEIKQTGWFKKVYDDTNDELAKKVLDNPENSGIDIKSDAYFFMKVRGRGGYVSFVCNIKDEKAFAAFIEKASHGETVKKDGNISIITSGSSVISWNSSRFVAVADAPDAYQGGGFDSRSGGESFGTDSLVVFAKEIYSLKNKKSLGSNSKFNSLVKETGDIHFWMNGGSMYGGSLPAMLALTKMSLLFEGNITAATINFENGKIVVDAKSYYNKELAALYKKYSMKAIDPAVFKKIPAGDVAAVMALNYPPEGLKEFVNLLGVDGLLNMFLAQENFSLDDFVKANKGDIIFAVSDFKVVKKEKSLGEGPDAYKYSDEAPEAKILFGASIGDRASFDRFLNLLSGKLKEEGGEMGTEMAKKIPYTIKDNWFLAGSDSAYIHSYGAATTEHAFISKISGHPFAGYIDIHKFINGARGVMDSTATVIADESLKVWQDIIFYGGEFKNDATLSHLEVNMVDKNTNSLKQLNKYLDFVATRFMKETHEVELKDVETDSIVPPPPPPAPKK